MNTGNEALLQQLLAGDRSLVALRLDEPADGAFAHPYLLWFIADNPVQNGWFPANLCSITSLIIDAIRREAPETLPFQANRALHLLTTGRTPGARLMFALIDLLIDSGAVPANGIDALLHKNPEAARYLIARGGGMSLAAAVGLDDWENVTRLFPQAGSGQRALALSMAIRYDHNGALAWLLEHGADPNVFPEGNGYLSYTTPLHQAVLSGNVEAIRLLLAAGADTGLKDRMYKETPPRWAQHFLNEDKRDDAYLERVREIIGLFGGEQKI